MKNNRVGKAVCVGETVLDIIFNENMPVAAKAGGSMLNSAVSLGRAGIPVQFVSDYGSDQAGDLIHAFLEENGVSTEFVSRYKDGKTALALAFLDQQQNASYSFYKIFPEERLTGAFPAAGAGDIVLFGSIYALTEPIRQKIIDMVRQSRNNGAFVIYDPNFRAAHLPELDRLKPLIVENIGLADLVRGSDEDFRTVFGAVTADEAYRYLCKAGCTQLVYTQGGDFASVIAPGLSRSFTVPPITPVSTIGAGDAFNAGIIHRLLAGDMQPHDLTAENWDEIIPHAIRFSADVCQGLDNYISVEFAGQLKSSGPTILSDFSF